MNKKPSLKISLIQLCSTDDPSWNQIQILQYLNSVPNDVDIVFLPENSLFMKITSKSEKIGFALNDPIYEPFLQWSRETQTHILFGGNPTKTKFGISNATIWVSPAGNIENSYDKIHLFDVDVEGQKPVRESDQFVAGDKGRIIEIEGWKIGLSVCYDVRFSDLYLEYAKQAVDIIAIPAAFLVPTGKAHWEVLMRARAIESQCFVVAAAQSGEHRGVSGGTRQTFGHSLVVEPWGSVLLDLDEQTGAGSAELQFNKIEQCRQQIPMASHRKL